MACSVVYFRTILSSHIKKILRPSTAYSDGLFYCCVPGLAQHIKLLQSKFHSVKAANMTSLFEQVLASSKSLTADERARLAHALIASLDQQQDDDAEQQWLAATAQRVGEIEAGYVTAVSWQDIKQQLSKDQSK